MSVPQYLTDAQIKPLLKWDKLIPAIERILGDLSTKDEAFSVVQPPRLIMPINKKNGALLSMPAFCSRDNALGCKLVTSYGNNPQRGLPSIFGTIFLFDADTGQVKVIMEATEITAWRTAAASVVATKHLHKGEKKVLAILGAGVQGNIHALSFRHYFNFPEVRVWNRTHEKAEKLCHELGDYAVPYVDKEECIKGADVIVTATYSSEPLVHLEWLKAGAHINAVGFGVNHHNEVAEAVYRKAVTVVDNLQAANKELKGLTEKKISFWGELGEVINKTHTLPSNTNFTIFHSLGMAAEDVITAKLVYEDYVAHNKC